MLLAIVTTLALPDGPSNSVEFSDLMKELHSQMKSACFIFEGEMTALERSGSAKSGLQPVSFQGLYAIRSGRRQAGLLEVYKTTPPKPPVHRSQSLLNNTQEWSDRPAIEQSFDPKTKQPKIAFAGPGALNDSPSPEWFAYPWYFWVYQFREYPKMCFENLGWELVDDRRCLKVKLGMLPGAAPSSFYKIFWVDLARGGHPLKVEEYYEDKLLYRVDGITLIEVPDVAGKNFWFPVTGTMNVYGSLSGTYLDYPMARQTYGVVLGSLQLNLDLPDSAFVVHTKPRTELANAVSLKRDRPPDAPFKKAERRKSDPASVKARLDAKLAEADQQAAEVLASSPAREPWNWVVISQAAIASVGVATIAFAVIWSRRRS